eukprot:COSAG01_NODE_1133_length_11566_cov_25.815819_16_plen_83_part_00
MSQLFEENLSKRIATVKSMIEVAKKELFQYCYDLINFTPKAGNSKKDGTEFLKEIKKLKISTDATMNDACASSLQSTVEPRR